MGSSVYHILAEAIRLIQDVAASLLVLPIWPSIVQTRWQTVRACEYRLAIVRWGSAAVLRACCAVVGAKNCFWARTWNLTFVCFASVSFLGVFSFFFVLAFLLSPCLASESVHRPPLHLGFVFFFSTPLFVPECVAEAVFAGRRVCVHNRPHPFAAARSCPQPSATVFARLLWSGRGYDFSYTVSGGYLRLCFLITAHDIIVKSAQVPSLNHYTSVKKIRTKARLSKHHCKITGAIPNNIV